LSDNPTLPGLCLRCAINTPKIVKKKFQLTDLGRLILTALGVTTVILLGIVLVAVFVPAKYSASIQFKWLRFGLITVYLVVFSLKAYWSAHKSVGFWCIFLGFLALYLLGVGHLWAVYGGLSTLEVMLVGGMGFICLGLVNYWVLGIRPDLRPRRAKSPWFPEI
jgi:hypothetical protein